MKWQSNCCTRQTIDTYVDQPPRYTDKVFHCRQVVAVLSLYRFTRVDMSTRFSDNCSGDGVFVISFV